MSDRGQTATSDTYPERRERRPSAVEKLLLRLAYFPQRLALRSPRPIRLSRPDATADPAAQLKALRYRLRREGLREEPVREALGLLARVAQARLGRAPDARQLEAAWHLVRGGRCVELPDLDAWPLPVALAAATAALAGIPAHVILPTAHLARRDADAMRPLHEAAGLSCGFVDEAMKDDERRAGYAADVAYCVHRSIALDYLRDRMVLKGRPRALRLRTEALTSHNPRVQHLMLRGLQFGIACEAETTLVDAAQWPVTITADASNSQEAGWLEQALRLARGLAAGTDYLIDEGGDVRLLEAGRGRLAAAAARLPGYWQGAKRREDIVCLALLADKVLAKERDYAVAGNNLQIGEEVLKLRAPEPGAGRLLRMLLELKESCTLTGSREVLARVAYQRFFRRYLRAGAVAQSARGLGPELWSIYGLRLVRLRSPQPALQVTLPRRLLRTQAESEAVVIERIRELHGHGIPVLVCTRTPQAAGAWANALKAAGIEATRLAGAQDEAEAAAFAAAAAPGAVTVATYFAARGIGSACGQDVAKAGGLRLLVVQLLAFQRQVDGFAGRCIPAGTPGSVQEVLALEDELLPAYLWERWVSAGGPLRRLMPGACRVLLERDYAHARDELLRSEDYLGDVLAFSGQQ